MSIKAVWLVFYSPSYTQTSVCITSLWKISFLTSKKVLVMKKSWRWKKVIARGRKNVSCILPESFQIINNNNVCESDP